METRFDNNVVRDTPKRIPKNYGEFINDFLTALDKLDA